MRREEGNCRSDETPPLAVDIGCPNSFSNRSISDSADNANPDDNTKWTDEKHNLYLEHLELSFVKQLHQSMGLLAQCSEKDKRGNYASQIRPINACDTSGQCRYWKNFNCMSGSLSHLSADCHNLVKSPREYYFKPMRMHSPLVSAEMPELFLGTENLREEGTGQNFVDDDNENKPNTKPRLKKLKTALMGNSIHHQILP